MNEQLIGYRKVLIWLVSIGTTYAINRGMPPEIADSMGGILIQVLPTIAATLFSYFNVAAKKSTANGQAAVTTQAAQRQATTATLQPEIQTPSLSQELAEQAAASRPPVADTMPPFDESDDCLTQEQKQEIAVWYAKPTTNPPKMPVIPKEHVTLYTDKLKQNEQRTAQANIDLMQQALSVFDPKEWDRVLKMRKNCDTAVWHRVNEHWRCAMQRWMSYGILLWKYQEGIPAL
jgi:hypothetical protein